MLIAAPSAPRPTATMRLTSGANPSCRSPSRRTIFASYSASAWSLGVPSSLSCQSAISCLNAELCASELVVQLAQRILVDPSVLAGKPRATLLETKRLLCDSTATTVTQRLELDRTVMQRLITELTPAKQPKQFAQEEAQQTQ
jgi:hypothetical protein